MQHHTSMEPLSSSSDLQKTVVQESKEAEHSLNEATEEEPLESDASSLIRSAQRAAFFNVVAPQGNHQVERTDPLDTTAASTTGRDVNAEIPDSARHIHVEQEIAAPAVSEPMKNKEDSTLQSHAATDKDQSLLPSTRWFTSNEVAQHNLPTDCWFSFFGQVYDLTSLIALHKDSPLRLPLIKFAGQDISHWFDPRTHQPKTRIDPESGLLIYALPHGRYVHIPPEMPTTEWDSSHQVEWWNDTTLCVGLLSSRARLITIVNTLSSQSDTLEVASEDSMQRIRERYLRYNSHASSYVFKRMGKKLDLGLTLTENGIVDDSDEMVLLGISPLSYIPVIHCCFADLSFDDEE